MTDLALPVQRSFEPRDSEWEARVRFSFDRQKVMTLIGARLTRISPGHCEIRLPFREDLSQQAGYFHAGIIGTVVDSAGGYAGFTLMPAGSDVLSVEFKLNLMSPADGELLIATGEVLKSGKNLVIARGEVYVTKAGRITHCATMQQTLMTMHGKAPEKVP
jgi:uncharacterized protein (TIGR00369 family)